MVRKRAAVLFDSMSSKSKWAPKTQVVVEETGDQLHVLTPREQ